MAARRIDVHFHLIPQFYADMVYAAGSGPAIGRYPDWSPELALEVMDQFEVETALMSLGQPGMQFCKPAEAKTLARRCNDYSAELNAKHSKRFGAFGTVSMWTVKDAVEEIGYCLDTLKFSGVSLFASYDGKFLGDATNLLVINMEQGRDMARKLGKNSVVLMRGHGFSAAADGLLKLVRMSVYLPRNARILLAAMRMGEFKAMSENEIKTRNSFRAGAPEMQRGWEFWARRAGCGDMLADSKGGV